MELAEIVMNPARQRIFQYFLLHETGTDKEIRKALPDIPIASLYRHIKILAKSIVIEAAELLECFQWNDEEYDLQHVKEELADVIVYSQNLLDKLGLDADEIVNMKMGMNERKYPVEKAKGKSAKYDCL